MNFNFKVDKAEVLRYMGYKGQNMSLELAEKIDYYREIILKEAEFRFITELHSIKILDDGVLIENSNLKLRGEDIKNHLKDSKEVLLMATTLGNRVEKLIRLKERVSLEDAIILDACATTLIEEFCDTIEEEFIEEIKGENKGTTFRYSPGYGDLPIETQKEFLKLLNTERRIGLLVSESNILMPRKSVTAIIGVYNGEKKVEKKGCESCPNYDRCSFRREGVVCGS
ncbi:MAG: methionine synthase [Sarcina sp.]